MTALAEQMLARAEQDGLAEDHPLRVLGKAFSKACSGFYADPQTVTVKQFMGHWARARRAWCEYTGESLI